MLYKEDLIGKQKIASNGQMMTIIDYTDYNNITVQFEDGTIVKNRSMSAFYQGSIRNPNCFMLKNKCVSHTGEENIANNGQKIKIVSYTNRELITVQFEDGTLVKGTYNMFKKGTIRNPNSNEPIIRKTKDEKFEEIKKTVLDNLSEKFEYHTGDYHQGVIDALEEFKKNFKKL